MNFYDANYFFRVIPGFVAQFGLSSSHSLWHGATIPDDPVVASNKRGRLAFATSGPNSRTTQLFINLVDNSRPGYRPYSLDEKGYAAFAEIVSGLDVLEALNMSFGEEPNQSKIMEEGNSYLQHNYPGLSCVTKVTHAPTEHRLQLQRSPTGFGIQFRSVSISGHESKTPTQGTYQLLEVESVSAGSPAAEAVPMAVQPGDTLLSVNGTNTRGADAWESLSAVVQRVQAMAPSEAFVEWRFLRNRHGPQAEHAT